MLKIIVLCWWFEKQWCAQKTKNDKNAESARKEKKKMVLLKMLEARDTYGRLAHMHSTLFEVRYGARVHCERRVRV